MKLVRYLANLGYGTRRQVTLLFDYGRVTDAAGRRLPHDAPFTAHDDVRVDDEPLDVPPGTVVMLHKPVDYVTSTREASRTIYELLPPRWLQRTPILAPIGRLDRDTSGLLLLTDDGQLNHRITSPRTHLPKTYVVRLAGDLTGEEGARLASGTLMLDGETTPLAPATFAPIDARSARVTITEGRYHQVRRMLAALGNHVEALHREAVGALTLGELAEGEWRVVERAAISDQR